MGLSSLKAEDRVFGYLVDNFSHEVALAIANRAEFLLATRWEHQQEKLRGTVSGISTAKMAQSNTRPGNSNSDGEQNVIDLLSEVPADRTWWIAHRVRDQIEGIGSVYCRPKGAEAQVADVIAGNTTEAQQFRFRTPSGRHACD